MYKKVILILFTCILTLFIGIGIGMKTIENEQYKISSKTIKEIPQKNKEITFQVTENNIPVFKELKYNNLSLDELTNQLNKSLNSTLTNKGDVFAKASLQNNVDPYLVTAIALHETGCKWNCSRLVKECNNVGGVKGSPSCNGTSYRKYNTLDEGITKFIENIKHNYYDYGLNNAYKMQKKYTGGSTIWANKVNNYINNIKSK